MRGKVTRWFNGQMQYTLSRGDNDTNGIDSFPANDYDLSGEWARADFDRRHRFNLLGRTTAIKLFDLGVGLSMNSGGPYNETLGARSLQQRPRPRAARRRAAQQPRDAPASRRSTSARRATSSSAAARTRATVTLGFDAFNVLNRVNYGIVRRHAELAAVRPAGVGAVARASCSSRRA